MSKHYGPDGERHKRRQAKPDDPMFGKLFFVSINDPAMPSGMQSDATDMQETARSTAWRENR
jgi:hypothetical protein